MAELVAEQGLFAGRRFPLRDRTRIGRAPDNEIVLGDDNLASRYHAEILREDGDYSLRDLGSKNGARINDEEIGESTLLTEGDRVRIGQTVFLFRQVEEVRASRFSEAVVHIAPGYEGDFEQFKPAKLPPAGQPVPAALVQFLAQLFDAESREISDLLRELTERLTEMMEAAAGVIYLCSTTGAPLPLTAAGVNEKILVGARPIHTVLDRGVCALASPAPAEEDAEAEHSCFVPLPHRGRSYGALQFSRPGAPFTPADLARLYALAPTLSGGVRHLLRLEQHTVTNGERSYASYIGVSPAVESIRNQIQRLAGADTTVLVTGETGTGKELVARLLHHLSGRSAGPFMAINCAAIPERLIESELFGYEAGAFTGADHMHVGRIEAADGGTLFLDEVGEMSMEVQPKLLRFLEERVHTRVGGLRAIPTDVRIVAATNRNLEDEVKEGNFREDLLFRLNVMRIALPPLRARIEDIRPLVEELGPQLASRVGKPFLGVIDNVWTLLQRYPWPGNVRELRHSVERALILSDDGILRPEHFQLTMPEPTTVEAGTDIGRTGGEIHVRQTTEGPTGGRAKHKNRPPSLEEVEADAIRRALRYAGGNRRLAADILKIHRNTLTKKIQDYGIEA